MSGNDNNSNYRDDSSKILVNLTPHDIHIYDRETKSLVYTFVRKGDDPICRCIPEPIEPKKTDPLMGWDDVTILVKWAPNFCDVDGLLAMKEDHLGWILPDILVSMAVGDWIRSHPEKYQGAVYGPDTGVGGGVRNEAEEIIGTFNLVLYKERTTHINIQRF